jgi:hypothetical protein
LRETSDHRPDARKIEDGSSIVKFSQTRRHPSRRIELQEGGSRCIEKCSAAFTGRTASSNSPGNHARLRPFHGSIPPRPNPSVGLTLHPGSIGPASVRRLLMISGRGYFPDGSYPAHKQPITKEERPNRRIAAQFFQDRPSDP